MMWKAILTGKGVLAATVLMAALLSVTISTPAMSGRVDPTTLTYEHLYVEVCSVQTNRILTTPDHTDLNDLARYDVYPWSHGVSYRFYYDRVLEENLEVDGVIKYHVWLNASRKTKAKAVFVVYDVYPDGTCQPVHEDHFKLELHEKLKEHLLTGKHFEYTFRSGHTICVEFTIDPDHGDAYMYYDWVEAPSYVEFRNPHAEEKKIKMTLEYVDVELNGVRTERILTHPDYTELNPEPREDDYNPPEQSYRFYLYGPLVDEYRMDGVVLYHVWIEADRDGVCSVLMRIYDVDEDGVHEPVHEDHFEVRVREGLHPYDLRGEWATHTFRSGHTICVEFTIAHMPELYAFLYDSEETHSYVDMPGVVVDEAVLWAVAFVYAIPVAVILAKKFRGSRVPGGVEG